MKGMNLILAPLLLTAIAVTGYRSVAEREAKARRIKDEDRTIEYDAPERCVWARKLGYDIASYDPNTLCQRRARRARTALRPERHPALFEAPV